MTFQEEIQCIRSVLNGNLNEFEKLITDNKVGAFSIAESMVKNSSDANDVLQEAYINAFNYLHTFNAESRFSTWFYRIVVNQALKWIRKNKQINKPLKFLNQSSYIIDTNHGLEQLEKHEKKKSIQRILKILKPKEALMLNMFYLQELSIKEIHQCTGFSIPNIKVLLHRGRANFLNFYQQTLRNNERQ